MAQLPRRCAWAIASAFLIYRDIGLQVRSAGAGAWEQRMQVSGRKKVWRLCQGWFVAAYAISRKNTGNAMPRNGLWTKAGTGM